MSFLDDIKWDADGLVPVIAQEQGSGDVLMFAWMNRAALALTAFFTLKALGMETRPNPMDGQFLRQIAYMAVMVTFVAALVQTWAQGRVNPTHAVLFYALEPVSAAVFAYLRFGEKLSLRSGIGAASLRTRRNSHFRPGNKCALA